MMAGSWLVLLVAVVVSAAEPSCEELRELWEVVSRSADASRRTNEIPILMPMLYPEGRRKNHRHRQDALFQNRFPSGQSFHAPQAEEAFGRFVDEAAWPSQGAEKKGAPTWGRQEDVGSFGRFVDFEPGVPLATRARPRTWTGIIHKEPCHQVTNKRCTIDEDCECSVWSGLRCYRGRCQSHSMSTGQDSDSEYFGEWYEAALPSSMLGMSRRSQRSTKSILM